MYRRFNTDYFNDTIAAYQLGVGFLPGTFPPTSGLDANGNNCLWLGLLLTIPGTNGNNATEVSAVEYARQPLITIPALGYSNQFAKLGPGLYTNKVGVAFPLPTSNWGATAAQPVVALGVWDASTSGNLLAVDALLTPRPCCTGSAPMFFAPYSLVFGINPGWERRGLISESQADAIAAYLFLNSAYSSPNSTLYIALCTQLPIPSNTGATISEVANASGYARNSITFHWFQIKSGRYGNSLTQQFPAPTNTWSRVMAFALVDSGTWGAGNMIYAGLLNYPAGRFNQFTPAVFPPGALQVGLGK